MASKTLHDAGITNFEALGRIGGRIMSTEIAGVTVELGANWIQGVDFDQPEVHPLMKIASKCKIAGTYSDYNSLTSDNTTKLMYFLHFLA